MDLETAIKILEHEVKKHEDIASALRLILQTPSKTAQEASKKRPIQRTLDNGTAEPPRKKAPKIELIDIWGPKKETGPRGEYERHIKPEEFNKRICLDILNMFITELSAQDESTAGVPVLHVTKKLGANRNNGYYTAKHLAKTTSNVVYVKYNSWTQRRGDIVGLMSRSRAHKLGLRILEGQIEETEKHERGTEAADS